MSVTSRSGWRNGKAYAQVYRTVIENGEKHSERVSSDVYASAADAPRRDG